MKGERGEDGKKKEGSGEDGGEGGCVMAVGGWTPLKVTHTQNRLRNQQFVTGLCSNVSATGSKLCRADVRRLRKKP